MTVRIKYSFGSDYKKWIKHTTPVIIRQSAVKSKSIQYRIPMVVDQTSWRQNGQAAGVHSYPHTHTDAKKKICTSKDIPYDKGVFWCASFTSHCHHPASSPPSPLTFTFLTVHLPFDLPSQPPWKQLPIYSRDWIWGREKSQQSKEGIYLFRPQTREYKALATFMMPSRKNIHKYWLCLGDTKEWSPLSFLYSFYFWEEKRGLRDG